MVENPIFSYTRRDYEGSRKEGLARIPILSGGQWTDLNATDPGVIILDYVHALVDMINYYQDHQALETFITTAKERANIFRLAKQLSYSIISSKGAIANVTFSSPITYDHPIEIPKHTIVSTTSGIQYLTMEDAYLDKGETSVVVPCSQGNIYEKVYTGTGISRFSVVEGAANQSVQLTASNIDVESVHVIDDIGNMWTPVDYIVFSNSSDRAYQVDLNPDDTITVKFGDGVRGVVPQETDTLTIKYVVTLAENGRVGSGELTELVTPVYDKGKYVELYVVNNKASSGGSSIQSSSDIRELAPGAIKAQGRAVTLGDFESLAKLVPGVLDAKAYDINLKPDLCLYHEVKVLIVPKNMADDVELLRDSVYKFLYNRMIPPTNLQVITPSIVQIDLHVVVKKLDSAVNSRLSYSIHSEIEKYFESRSGSIGEGFYPSELIATIQSVPGVRYVVSISPSDPMIMDDLSLAALGEVTVSIQ